MAVGRRSDCARLVAVVALLLLLYLGGVFRPQSTQELSKNAALDRNSPAEALPRERKVDLPEAALVAADNGPIQLPNGKFDSATAVVLTVAEWDDGASFERFVGSLRWSGFTGRIVIGLGTEISSGNERWLTSVGAETWPIPMDTCKFTYKDAAWNKKQKCPVGLPQFKLSWAQYALALMWLEQHPENTGGVLFANFHSYFQANPFEAVPDPAPVMLFEEHRNVSTKHWVVDYPVTHCRKASIGDKPMISSGAVMGSRAGIAAFLKAMMREFRWWVHQEQCRFPSNDAQAVLNYLVYSGKWDKLIWKPRIYPFRTSALAAVGVLGSAVTGQMSHSLIEDTSNHQWIDPLTGITDHVGFFLNTDGKRAPIVYQWEALGPTHKKWLESVVREVFTPVADGDARAEDLWSSAGKGMPFKPHKSVQVTSPLPPATTVALSAEEVSESDAESKCIPIPKEEGVFPGFGWPKGVDSATRTHELEALGLVKTSTNPIKVFLWNDKNPNKHREMGNLIDGLLTHPRYAITDDISQADVVAWISTMVRHEKEVVPVACKNVLVLDYSDGCVLQKRRSELQQSLGYFKRSFISRSDGVKTSDCAPMPTAWPLAYSGTDRMVLEFDHPRTLEIVCTLRDGGAWYNKVRGKVIKWTRDFIDKHSVPNTVVDGQITHGSHNSQAGGENKYTRTIHSAKIIVTCNPATWEGDHRLYEALLTGALVFVDKMDVLPMLPYPYQHKVHLIFYDSHDQAGFEELLLYYWKHPEEARTIAEAGYRWTLDHHMPKDRIDYIFSLLNPPIGTSNGTVLVGGKTFTTV